MKQKLIPNLKVIQKPKFNRSTEQSLHILSCNRENLKSMIVELSYSNPFLSYTYSNESVDVFDFVSNKVNLNDEILLQLRMQNEMYDEEVCEYLVSCLDTNGYFKKNFNHLVQDSIWNDYVIDYHIRLLRNCEPYGLFAFDLKECLKLQCEHSEKAESETGLILCDYLEDIALKHFSKICEEQDLELEEVEEGVLFIQSLNPKPGANYTTDSIYVNPECIVHVEQDMISVEMLNQDIVVSLENVDIENQSKEVQKYLKEQRRQAENVLSSIQKRSFTILQIMQAIVHHQKMFFLENAPLKHLTLEMIATECDLSISTISRTVSNKSFEFNNKYYPMKKMLVRSGNEMMGASDIQKEIISIIEKEDKRRPYSDDKIRKLLLEKGIDISRRTVTKYREKSFIFNSSKRKDC